MKYFLDTADPKEIEKWSNVINGVTSNPSILKKCNMTSKEFFKTNIEIFDDIFVQIQDLDELEELNHGIDNKDFMNIIFKVPLMKTADFDGYQLIRELKAQSFRTCGTITYDIVQFNQACELGCDFCIALFAKNDNQNFLEQCVETKKTQNFHTQIIAASFRNKIHVTKAILCGADYATVPPKIMEEVFRNDSTLKDYKSFYKE